MVVRKPLPRFVQVEPHDPVDLALRSELSSAGLHQPVAHPLGPALRLVEDRRQPHAENALEPGLLADLAEGAVLVTLAFVSLPFRKAPVVVPRSVHEEDLGHTVLAHDHAAGRSDLV